MLCAAFVISGFLGIVFDMIAQIVMDSPCLIVVGFAFEIEFFANDRCFTEEEIKEAIEKAYVLKDLGGVRPTLPSTEASSEDSTAE
jgi:hypothetical protein